MQIQNMRPGHDDGRGTVRLCTVFDLQLTDDVRINGLQLMRDPARGYRTWVPSLRGMRSVSFSGELFRKITELAVTEWEAQDANEFHRAA